jgi:hypothetical protein
VGEDAIPYKTPEGLAELNARDRRLTSRQRTVLFLVDGKRNLEEVRGMAVRAGVPETCVDELVDMGLLTLDEPTLLMPLDELNLSPSVVHVDLPLVDFPTSPGALLDLPSEPPSVNPAVSRFVQPQLMSVVTPAGLSSVVNLDDGEEESLLPPSLTLQPEDSLAHESMLNDPPAPDSWLPLDTEEPHIMDATLSEARLIMIRSVRQEAPIAGSLTLLRLRRARTREELSALLSEVEMRITKPHRVLAASQTMKRVRDLLEGRVNPARLLQSTS